MQVVMLGGGVGVATMECKTGRQLNVAPVVHQVSTHATTPGVWRATHVPAVPSLLPDRNNAVIQTPADAVVTHIHVHVPVVLNGYVAVAAFNTILTIYFKLHKQSHQDRPIS